MFFEFIMEISDVGTFISFIQQYKPLLTLRQLFLLDFSILAIGIFFENALKTVFGICGSHLQWGKNKGESRYESYLKHYYLLPSILC